MKKKKSIEGKEGIKEIIARKPVKKPAEKPVNKKKEKVQTEAPVETVDDKKPRKPRAPSKVDRISQYTMDGKYIRTFPSINDAVAAMEISRQTILDYINGKRYQTGGYLWGYDTETLAGKRIGR